MEEKLFTTNAYEQTNSGEFIEVYRLFISKYNRSFKNADELYNYRVSLGIAYNRYEFGKRVTRIRKHKQHYINDFLIDQLSIMEIITFLFKNNINDDDLNKILIKNYPWMECILSKL